MAKSIFTVVIGGCVILAGKLLFTGQLSIAMVVVGFVLLVAGIVLAIKGS